MVQMRWEIAKERVAGPVGDEVFYDIIIRSVREDFA